MNSCENLMEMSQPLFALLNTSCAGGVSSEAILANQCQHVGVLIKLEPAAGNTASDQVTVTLWSQNKAGSAETQLEIDGVYVLTGANDLTDTTLEYEFESIDDALEYVTAVADGTKEISLYFRVRSRLLQAKDEIYVRADLESVNARIANVILIAEWKNSGPDAARDWLT